MPRSKSWLTLLAFVAGACGGGGGTATTATVSADSAAKDSVAAAAAKAAAAATGPRQRHSAFDTLAAAGQRPLVREIYTYEASASDPFQPVLASVDRGPELADLRLIGITYDNRDPSNSLATFRENGSERRFLWRSGQRSGRILVVRIAEKDVTLRSDDFGVPREQSYSLRKPEAERP